MQEITNWLGQLGLGQYAQRFAENEIDTSVLPHLTDQEMTYAQPSDVFSRLITTLGFLVRANSLGFRAGL